MTHVVSSASLVKWCLRLSICVTAVVWGGVVHAAVDFARDIQPIISAKCFQCHGPDEGARKAKLRLDVRAEAIQARKGDVYAIKPGEPEKSLLLARVSSSDVDEVMPPPKEGRPLEAAEIALVRQWIQEGAHYAEHWAFVKPVRPSLPAVKDRSWPANGIDFFTLAAMESKGLSPSPPADAHTLIRRLALDLTGLPPTPNQVREFVEDRSPSALERAVDRLLASPSYGERWARLWMDIARYADSAGYGSDPLRLNIWPYRDWVIRAFNRNLPYDQFTREQIAGDLLPNPTEDQLIATAFHRNTMTNTEGGTDDEEWRVAAVKDRIAVTAQAWMGLTMACAQCHSHKFDPISQQEYYRFFALFNQSEDNDQPDERPTMPLYGPDQKRQVGILSNEIVRLERQLAQDSPAFIEEFRTWTRARAGGERWHVLEPSDMSSEKGTELVRLSDHSVLASRIAAPKEVFTVKARVPAMAVTGIRLEALTDESLPDKGPGHAGGNFVLNEFSASYVPDHFKPTAARFVRVELPGKDRMLSLAEVQVMSRGTNAALKGKGTQSSTDFGGPPELALDGNTDGHYDRAKSTTHTRSESDPWWEVDLGQEMVVDKVSVWNRTDNGLASRLDGARVVVLDARRAEVFAGVMKKAPATNETFVLDGSRSIKFQHASADHQQGEYEVAKAIDGSLAQKSGWAVGGELGKPHVAVFELSAPMGPGTVTLKLDHAFGDRQVLGRFRLSWTEDRAPLRVLPPLLASLFPMPGTGEPPFDSVPLKDWFRKHARTTADVNVEIAAVRKKLTDVKSTPVPVMRELAMEKRRATRFLNKGNFLNPGDVVEPGVPAAFGQWPEASPTNRLGVVNWLFSPGNPLTARVAANRFWAQLFGTGLVETEEDFGTQGQLPSHPELLDWLAVTFAAPKSSGGPSAPSLGWDMKALLKLMVTSATYRQSSRTTPEMAAVDPKNRLLSRYPRRRLDAEMVRDQALALSGLLTPKTGGPSVYPPQPDGLWKAAFNGERTYATSKGEDRYRRGLYTVWRRTVPYPSMSTFDAPSRETCTLRRLPTNTPLQAFVTLNDPVFVEAAQALARRIVREGGATPGDRIRHALSLVLCRVPTSEQESALKALFESELAHYRERLEDAVKLAPRSAGGWPDGVGEAEAAAWTVIANVLLNLDGVLSKS